MRLCLQHLEFPRPVSKDTTHPRPDSDPKAAPQCARNSRPVTVPSPQMSAMAIWEHCFVRTVSHGDPRTGPSHLSRQRVAFCSDQGPSGTGFPWTSFLTVRAVTGQPQARFVGPCGPVSLSARLPPAPKGAKVPSGPAEPSRRWGPAAKLSCPSLAGGRHTPARRIAEGQPGPSRGARSGSPAPPPA